ncbi:MAG: hypothetical protein N2422_02790 [Rhodobacteraceae bacterium]|nr:hypothetical protein [Paracoccaceae bacterium]
MRAAAALTAVALLLAGCGTPREQCIAAATRELATVDALIAESQANLRRGYAYQPTAVSRPEWRVCDWIELPPRPDGTPVPPRPRYCLETATDTVQKPVPIDPVAEQRKLDNLLARRKVLNREAAAAVEACKASFPE